MFETACIISDSGCFSMGHIIAFVKKKKNKKSLDDKSVVIHKLRTSLLLVLDTNKNNPFKYHFEKSYIKCIIQTKHRAQEYMEEAWERKQSF